MTTLSTHYGSTTARTFSTTISATSNQASATILFPWPPITSPLQYTTVSATPLPILVLTDVVGIVVDPSGRPIQTGTLIQISPSEITGVPPHGSGGAGSGKGCKTWYCWTRAEQIGTIVGSVLVAMLILGVMIWTCCIRPKGNVKVVRRDEEEGEVRRDDRPRPMGDPPDRKYRVMAGGLRSVDGDTVRVVSEPYPGVEMRESDSGQAFVVRPSPGGGRRASTTALASGHTPRRDVELDDLDLKTKNRVERRKKRLGGDLEKRERGARLTRENERRRREDGVYMSGAIQDERVDERERRRRRDEDRVHLDTMTEQDHRRSYPHKNWDDQTEHALKEAYKPSRARNHERTRSSPPKFVERGRGMDRGYGVPRSDSTPSTHRKHRYNRHKPRKEKEKENPKESKKWWGLLPLFLGAVNILAEPEGGWGKVAKKKTEVERSFEPRLERKRDRSYSPVPGPRRNESIRLKKPAEESRRPTKISTDPGPSRPPRQHSPSRPPISNVHYMRRREEVPTDPGYTSRYAPLRRGDSSDGYRSSGADETGPSRPQKAEAAMDKRRNHRPASPPRKERRHNVKEAEPVRRTSVKVSKRPRETSRESQRRLSLPRERVQSARSAAIRPQRRASDTGRQVRSERRSSSVPESQRRRVSRRAASTQMASGFDGTTDQKPHTTNGAFQGEVQIRVRDGGDTTTKLPTRIEAKRVSTHLGTVTDDGSVKQIPTKTFPAGTKSAVCETLTHSETGID